VCFKLPARAHQVGTLRLLPGVRILWAVRDPRDVVASMITLVPTLNGVTAPFAAHPHLGPTIQVPAMIQALGGAPPDLIPPLREFAAQAAVPPEARTPEQLAVAAALHWRLKQELLRMYDAAGLAYRVAVYEKVVARPREEIGALLEYLELRWHDDVLRHHTLHTGVSVGNTDNTRAIDQRSVGRWKEVLDATQLDRVREICGPAAAGSGYTL
jgi:hypothetical protein